MSASISIASVPGSRGGLRASVQWRAASPTAGTGGENRRQVQPALARASGPRPARAGRCGRSGPRVGARPAAPATGARPAATKLKKFIAISGSPVKCCSRRRRSWVAMPVAQLLRWQMRRYLQPSATIGAVPKPKLSAPRMAALITSRPVFRPPSTCTRTRWRRWLRRSVCCISDRPSSQGVPAWWIEDTGEAPVPPSWPDTVIRSA